MNLRVLFWLLFAATTVLGLMLAFWAKPQVVFWTDGLMPYDFYLTGYSLETARAIAESITTGGTDAYLSKLIRTDFVYMVLLTSVLIISTIHLTGERKVLRYFGIFFSLTYLVLDIAENVTVMKILNTVPEKLSDALLIRANCLTVSKYSAGGAVLLLLAFALLRYRKN